MLMPILTALMLAVPQDDPEAKFRELVDAAKADPEAVDYRALRLASAKTEAFNPYRAPEDDPFEAVEHEVKNGEKAAALVALDDALRGAWADPTSQFRAAGFCDQIGETDRRELHRALGTGLTDALLESGDGRTPESAVQVLGVGEEYFALDVLGLRYESRAHVVIGGHHYDVFKIKRPGDEPFDFYFDIDIPWEWLGRHVVAGLRPESSEKIVEPKSKPLVNPGKPGKL